MRRLFWKHVLLFVCHEVSNTRLYVHSRDLESARTLLCTHRVVSRTFAHTQATHPAVINLTTLILHKTARSDSATLHCRSLRLLLCCCAQVPVLVAQIVNPLAPGPLLHFIPAKCVFLPRTAPAQHLLDLLGRRHRRDLHGGFRRRGTLESHWRF